MCIRDSLACVAKCVKTGSGRNGWRSGHGTVSYTHLTKDYGTWYYVQNGILNWDYTGRTKYYGTWYYVENGVLNWDYTGLTKYYDTWYLSLIHI